MRERSRPITAGTRIGLGALALASSIAAPAFGGGGEDDAFGIGGVTDPFASPDPLELAVHAGQSAVKPGEISSLAVVLALEEGWHVNAHEPNEEWLIPTEVVLTAPEGIEVIEVVYPEPVEIELSFSDTPMAVYEGQAPLGVRFRMPGKAAGGTDVLVRGIVSFQACNDQACLPPAEKSFALSLALALPDESITASTHPVFERITFGATESTPIAAGVTTPAPRPSGDDPDGGVTAWLTRTVEVNFGNPFIAAFVTLVAGLLSAATPCVYPMIPITARILLGRGGENPALGRMHAGMYFVGIIVVYALLGLIAGAGGGGFNEIMRIPAVIFAFAVLFALLGLSMLGLFEIQIPSSIATSVDGATSRRSGLFGTMFMGIGAGLVVSPCVGPVVFAILAQIANQIATIEAAGGGAISKSGQLTYGAVLMGAYGAGLGVPFLVVGLFSSRVRVAKPGAWMTLVRVALGVVILYFAVDYFFKALETAGVVRPIANAILAGSVLTFLAVLWGVFRPNLESGPHAGWHRVRHASTILMLVVGVFYLWTGLARSGLVPGGSSATFPAAGSLAAGGPARQAIEDSHGLTWHRDFAAAEAEAREAGLPIFIDFYAHWCANCKVFSANAARPGALRTALESVVRAKIYDTDPIFAEFRRDPRYGELTRGLPFFLLRSSDGEFLWKGTDYRAETTMIEQIERARSREAQQAGSARPSAGGSS